ncbi:MAG: aminotransferase class V-fold PLP-dependent enzyme [bacterium]
MNANSASLDVDRLRRDTPGCAETLHLDNAGSSLMPRPVLEAVVAHLKLESRIGGYAAAATVAQEYEETYRAVAELIGGRADEIALMESATRAFDAAIYSLPWRRGDRILSSQAEYGANWIAMLQIARRTGAELVPIPDDEFGQISIDALEREIDERARLIVLTHVPTNGGLVNPASEVGRVARAAGVPYLLDACQSAGQIPLDVEEIGCDFLTATGRKYLRGPRGTGFLWIRWDLACELEPAMLDSHGARWTSRDGYTLEPGARRFETFEADVAGRLGLGVAADYARTTGVAAMNERIRALASTLRGRLAAMPGVVVRDKGVERCGLVTFTVDGIDPWELRQRLRARGVNVQVSGRELTRLDMEARGLEHVVRASPHAFNTEAEIERFLEELDGARA